MTLAFTPSNQAGDAPDLDYAVLLMAYGGPDSLDDVERYLLDVRGGRPLTAEQLEHARARYAAIGGRSPLLEITRRQAAALSALVQRPVYVGMRHWSPYIPDVVLRMAADGVQHAVALCMTPHYSPLSVGAYAEKLQQGLAALSRPFAVISPDSWRSHPLYIGAVSDSVGAALRRFPRRENVQVVFTAHSLPIRPADPYAGQVQETAALVARRAEINQGAWRVCYQSRAGGAVPWLGPSLEETIDDLHAQGATEVLVAPLSFVSDHVETLYDIDIEARGLAEQRGMRLERSESLNTTPAFIDALAQIVRQAAKELSHE